MIPLARVVVPLSALLLAAACTGAGGPEPGAPPHHRPRGFRNPNPDFETPPLLVRLGFLGTFLRSPSVEPYPHYARLLGGRAGVPVSMPSALMSSSTSGQCTP